MTIRVLINGASGKMGQEAVCAILENPQQFTLVGAAGKHDPLADMIKNEKADVVIDLTTAKAVFANSMQIIEAGARPVIGTSGLLKSQIVLLEQQCNELKRGGIIAPNFSIGAVLMMKFAKESAKHFSYAEIIEMHHAQKKDSPSGTAIRTAELIASSREKDPAPFIDTKETLVGARGAFYEKTPIHSVRLPGFIANQEVIFSDAGETLSIKHVTADRKCFMPGILFACKKVMELDSLIYGLENLL